MSRINRVPFGLQHLLDSQNLGNNPSDLSEVVAGTIDVEKFLNSTLTRVDNTSNVATGIGTTLGHTVPTNEIWEPINWHLEGQNNFNAGGSARFKGYVAVPSIDPVGAGGLVLCDIFETPAPVILDAVSTGVRYGGHYQWQNQMLFGPGSVFTGFVIDLNLTGASFVFSSSLLYRRYRF